MTPGPPFHEPFREMDDALERGFARRMRVARIRLLLWLVAILPACWLWPQVWWIKWLLVIPLLSLLFMGGAYLQLKRKIARR